jgi:hypothetical protein
MTNWPPIHILVIELEKRHMKNYANIFREKWLENK